MQPTEKLYFTDSGLLRFDAQVIQVESGDGMDKILLDRTAFYPTGGGQPNDTGWLNGMDIIDVVEDGEGRIIHVVEWGGRFTVGERVEGSVDPIRRLDHLQQHSGQHILSQAFVQACGAETRSFHLGSQTSTIDIALQSPSHEAMCAAEDIANAVVFENRPMRIHLLDEEGAAQLPLRKESAVTGAIRVIEVEGFDWSPCGGTHAKQTGQIGLIAVKSFERVKGNLTRVEFVCGSRALKEYRLANQSAVKTARLFSAERDAAPELAAKAIQDNKSLKKRLKDLLELAMTAEAAQRLQDAPIVNGFKLVKVIFEGRDGEEMRMLASKLTQQETAVALLANREASTARLIFARSTDLPQNMGQLLAEACQTLGGRGGGKPDMAQGGGEAQKLDEALNAAAAKL